MFNQGGKTKEYRLHEALTDSGLNRLQQFCFLSQKSSAYSDLLKSALCQRAPFQTRRILKFGGIYIEMR